ncbi:IS630 family transposase [Glycomyces tenuis]|uniref:IS630 family transposase n=1 Tax=Glycomyces tenuis TaxID=58116 RepID=UPI0004113ABC|nr:IS630 family transposase [Glycomyces tenuis]
MRKFSPSQQEVLRKRVMAAVLHEGMSDEAAVALFGVSPKSIGSWRARYESCGEAGLCSGKTGAKPGQGRRLSPSEEAAVRQTIREFNPDDFGLGGLLWTRAKSGAFIKAYFGICYSLPGLSKLMARLGLSFQRPDRRAREADPEAVAAWTDTESPAIQAKAEAEDAVIMFGDQVGARSDHLSGRTWGAKGQTPVVARTGKRFGLNAMSAIATNGKMYFTIFPGRFDAATCIAFFAKLIGHFDRKIHLGLDRHSVHRSKAVREWVEAHAEEIELHFLPAYAPHLNSDELVNADLKRQLADRVITSREQLVAETRSVLRSIQKLPAKVIGYCQAPHTNYTLKPLSD